MIKQLQTIFAEKRPLKAKEKTEILSALAALSNTINSHNIFTLSQFDEAMEKIATEAKGEVDAFIQNKMNSLALASMKETNALNLKDQNPLLPKCAVKPLALAMGIQGAIVDNYCIFAI